MVDTPEHLQKAKVRLDTVRERYEMRGYKVTVNKVTDHETIDVIAENKEVVIALEVTNWNINGRLRPMKLNGWKRHWKTVKDDMKDNNDKREFIKRLIYNYEENIQFMLSYLLKEEVELEQYEEEEVDYIKVLRYGEYFHIPRKKISEEVEDKIEGDPDG